jgi:CHAT domain-containing protein
MSTVQIMLLPPSAGDGLPQVLLEEGGIWRDMTVPQANVVSQTEVKTDLEQHLSELMRKVGGMPPALVLPENPGFKTRFKVRYEDLLPKEVRETLKKTADDADAAGGDRPLLQIFLKPGLEWIPWELLYDGKSFLGLRFAVARLPILREPVDVRSGRERRVNSVVSLLARHVLQDGIFADWQTTFDGFSANGGWARCFPSAAAVDDYPSVVQLDSVRTSADIVHVTCHGGLKKGSNYYWTLDHLNPQTFDYVIDPDLARTTVMEKRPLVFGNACASIATKAEDFGAMHGFGSNFMIGGALNFVGTFAPITKTMAVTFARRFYQRLLGTAGGATGLPIAQALLATKESFHKENCQDPSYLFYCLYGPPDSTYKPE